MLNFPGASGYQITWAPGAIRIPLEITPSGHLAFTLDNFDTLPETKSGVKDEELILHTSPPLPDVISTSSAIIERKCERDGPHMSAPQLTAEQETKGPLEQESHATSSSSTCMAQWQ